jgi:hypothetical protein
MGTMSTPRVMIPRPKPARPLPCGSAPAIDVMNQGRTGQAARGAPGPNLSRQRQTLSMASVTLASRSPVPSEETRRRGTASYYEGPLND